MKRFFVILICILFSIGYSQVTFAKKNLCKCPIYFFENINKNDFFIHLDEFLQQKNYKTISYYPDFGYIQLAHKIKKKNVTLDYAQYGNDIYLFFDIDKKTSSFSKEFYKYLKQYSVNSYQFNDDYFCKEFKRDIVSVSTKKTKYLKESDYNPNSYKISAKRYVGYKKYKMKKDKDKQNNKKNKKNKKKSKNKKEELN